MINKQLKRQLARYFGDIDSTPTSIQKFSEAISDHYDHLESKIKMLERSLEITTNEFIEYTEALKQKEEHLRTTQRIAGIGSWEVVLKNKENTWQNTAQWSDEAYRIFGLQPGEIEINEETFTAMVHPDDRELVANAFVNAIEENKPYKVEHRILLPNGEQRTVLQKAEIQHDPETGIAHKVIGSVLDITEQKKINEKILTNEAHLKASQKIAGIGSWELTFENLDGLDKSGLTWSDETYRIFGEVPSEIEVNTDLFYERVHPDDREKVSAAFAKAIETGEEYGIEHKIQLRNGAEKIVFERGIIKYHPITKNPLKVIGTVQDITEWKSLQKGIERRESHLNASQRIAKTGSWEISLTNVRQGTHLWSDETFRIFGFEPREIDVTYNMFIGIVSPQDRSRVERMFFRALKTGEVFEIEHRVTLKNGSERIVFERGEFEYDPITKKPIKVIGTVQDITEWKTMQEKILSSETHLKASQRISKTGSWEVQLNATENRSQNPIRWSDETYRIFGIQRKEKEISTAFFYSLIHPDDREKVKKAFNNAIESKTGYQIEFRIVMKDGTVKTVFEKGEINLDPITQKPLNTTGTIQDITEWKEIQKKIITSEAHLNASQRIAKIGSWEADLISLDNGNNNPVQWTDETYRIFGLKRGEKEITNEVFYAHVHPDDREKVEIAFETALQSKSEFMVEFRIITPTGVQKTVFEKGEVTYDPITQLPLKSTGTIQDITEWKEIQKKIITSEAHLSASQRIAKIGSWEADLVNLEDRMGVVNRWSEETYRIFGMEHDEKEITTGLFYTLVHPDDKKTVENTFTNALKSGEPFTVEFRIILANGAVKYILERGEFSTSQKNQKPYKVTGTMQDITEWKEIQEKILTSEAHLNASQHIAKVGSWRVDIPTLQDTSSNNIHWSEETFRIFGLTPNKEFKVSGNTFFGMIHPEEVKLVESEFNKMISKGTPMDIEHRIITANGDERIVAERAEATYDEKTGLPLYVMGTTQDITLQKTAELTLKKAEANLRTILENTDTAFILLDNEGRVVSFNNMAFQLAQNMDMAEKSGFLTVGKKYIDWMLPERRDEVEQTLLQVAKDKTPLQYEVNYTKLDGEIKWLSARMSPIANEEKQLLGIIVSARDITQRKRNEQLIKESNERYNMVLKATNDVIWDWDLTTNTFYRSENYNQVFGYPTTTDNNLWLTRMHEDDREKVEMGVSKQIKDPNAHKWEQEYRFYRQNGEIAYVQDKAYIIRDGNNKPIRMVGAMQDETPKKLAEIELTKLTNDLVQRNTDLEQFAYIVSHNLRAPLANIIGFTDSLISDVESFEDKTYFIQALAQSVKKLDEVIIDLNTILSVKREINERKEPILFKEITYDVIASIYSSISREGIRISQDFDEIEGFTTIKSYIYSIFYNLISNAIKYRNPETTSTLEIKSQLKNGMIILTFKDNGLGIDLAKKSQQVFGLYKRFHKQVEGKGMGLYMVKTQVETLGGRINIKSELNKGTEFTIEFENE